MLRNILRGMFGRKKGADASPSLLKASVLAAESELAGDRYQQAVDSLDPVLQREPNHAEALFLRGTAELRLERPHEAMVDLERAVALSPREPRYLYNLAVAHWITGGTERTVQLCNEAVRVADFHPARNLLANIVLPGNNYLNVLSRMHARLKPHTYIEVGIAAGLSLKLALPETLAIGIDPEPRLIEPVGPNQRVVPMTSDDYFQNHDVIQELGGHRIDMAFIDGMHQFEYALRDFINIERLAKPDSVILVHDCYPLDSESAMRERATLFWTGDIWRLVLLLRKHRPDLSVHTIATPPTGLGMILNLDPSSRILADRMDEIVRESLTIDYDFLENRKRELLNVCRNDWDAIAALLDSRRGAS